MSGSLSRPAEPQADKTLALAPALLLPEEEQEQQQEQEQEFCPLAQMCLC
jgi:hypothetical protein